MNIECLSIFIKNTHLSYYFKLGTKIPYDFELIGLDREIPGYSSLIEYETDENKNITKLKLPMHDKIDLMVTAKIHVGKHTQSTDIIVGLMVNITIAVLAPCLWTTILTFS